MIVFAVFQNEKKIDNTTFLFKPQDSAVIAVNGIKVHKQEYLLHLKKEIAMTYNHFYLKHGINNHPDFWTTTYGNTTPIDYIKNRTDNKVADSKIIHALAVENNIISNFDFKEFTHQWKAYNEERQKKKASGQTVYGQVYTTMSDYYFYLLGNLEIRVSEKIKKEKFSANIEALKNYYETIKQDKFGYVKKAEIEQFGFPYQTIPYKEAILEIEVLNKKVLNKQSLSSLKKEYPKSIYKNLVFYDSVPIHGEDNPDQILKETALELEFGNTKTVRTQEGVYFIKLTQPLEKEYYPYEKVKDLVLGYYQEEKYNTYLSQLKQDAVVSKNAKIYDKLSSIDFK